MANTRNLIPSPALREQLQQCGSVVSKTKGTILFRRGDEAAGLYLILSGKVSLTLDAEGSIFPTRVLGPGCIAGLPSTVSGSPYSLTAEVVQDAKLAFVPRADVVDCLQKHPGLCLQAMKMLSGEISNIRSALKNSDPSKYMRE